MSKRGSPSVPALSFTQSVSGDDPTDVGSRVKRAGGQIEDIPSIRSPRSIK